MSMYIVALITYAVHKALLGMLSQPLFKNKGCLFAIGLH